jgi:hypothetical protein
VTVVEEEEEKEAACSPELGTDDDDYDDVAVGPRGTETADETMAEAVGPLESKLVESRGGRKVRLIDLPIPIRSSDCIGQYNQSMSSSNFCIRRLCRSILSSNSFIDLSSFLVLCSNFWIVRLYRPVLSKKSLYRYFIC